VKKKELPFLYRKALSIFQSLDSELSEKTVRPKKIYAEVNRKFRLSKDDIKILLKELEKFGVKRSRKGYIFEEP